MRVGNRKAGLDCWLMLALCLFCMHGAVADGTLANQIQQKLEQGERTAALQTGVTAFYAQRNYAPVWQDSDRLAALIAAISGLSQDGLNPEDYHLSRLTSLQRADRDRLFSLDELADLDLDATDAYLRALSDLHWGKVDPRRIDSRYSFSARPADASQVLNEVGGAVEQTPISEIFERMRPPNPVYARLRDALVRLRQIESDGGWPTIPDGPGLKLGDTDPRIPLLRGRLRLGGYLGADQSDSEEFDFALDTAVREFQSEQYLDVDGTLGRQTRAALNVPVQARIDQVRVNLERARWLLREVEGDFVLVDIAGYKVTYFKSGEPIWRTRAQVGRRYRRTPSFKSAITTITFNPTWTVPPTILREDLLPKIRRDPAVLARSHLRVFNDSGQELTASSIDWQHPRGIVLRQDAGIDNSLGRVVIQFPNPYGVYMHDTPHAELFVRGQRAFSSGCIRIERPMELVEHLLADTPGWSHDAIERAVATGQTRTVALGRPITLLVMYWSVDTHGGARIAFKPDVYATDSAILRALDRPRPSLRDRDDLHPGKGL